MEENNVKGGLVSVRNIIRVLTVLVVICVFCPAFLVSCSGQNLEVSVMTAVGGLESQGQVMVEPHFEMIICLLIPVVILIVFSLKKMKENLVAIVAVIGAVVDFIIWMVFKSNVKKIAGENYCSFKSTGWYTFNQINLALIAVLAILVLFKILQLDRNLLIGSNNNVTGTFNNVAGRVSQFANDISSQLKGDGTSQEEIIGYCPKCGSPIESDCKFCTACGAPVPEKMIEEAKIKKEAAEIQSQEEIVQDKFCIQCGTKLENNDVFCNKCGTKVEG